MSICQKERWNATLFMSRSLTRRPCSSSWHATISYAILNYISSSDIQRESCMRERASRERVAYLRDDGPRAKIYYMVLSSNGTELNCKEEGRNTRYKTPASHCTNRSTNKAIMAGTNTKCGHTPPP